MPPVERSHTPKGRRARDRILAAAERLFATAGFHGASIREVARAARIPLATAVYHFARKEQLYAAVLERIGEELVAALADDRAGRGRARVVGPTRVGIGVERSSLPSPDDWAARLDAFARALISWTARNPERVRLLLRELLDNPARVARASKLPLAPFLEQSAALVEGAARAGAIRAEHPELVVMHLVGAASYVVAAWPTIERIVGPARARRLAEANEQGALAFARTTLGLHPEDDHATGAAATAGAARARAPRATNDGSRRGTDDAPRRRVPAR